MKHKTKKLLLRLEDLLYQVNISEEKDEKVKYSIHYHKKNKSRDRIDGDSYFS